jgi:hypothetical protein
VLVGTSLGAGSFVLVAALVGEAVEAGEAVEVEAEGGVVVEAALDGALEAGEGEAGEGIVGTIRLTFSSIERRLSISKQIIIPLQV